MTRDELVECIKQGLLEVLQDTNNDLAKMALFSYLGSLMQNAPTDSTEVDISDFKDGTFEEVYMEFQDALVEFISNYK